MAQKSDREGLKKKYVDYLGNLIIDGKIKQDILTLTKTRINYLRSILETKTINGITCTDNGDGTYTLNGESTATVVFNLGTYSISKGTYKLLGCASGGSYTTYYLDCRNDSYDQVIDTGKGIVFSSNGQVNSEFRIVVAPGQKLNNIVYKPMLTNDLSATYNDFVSGFESLTPDIKMDLLWKKVESGGSFIQQTISLDLSKYEFVYIKFNIYDLTGKISKITKVGGRDQIISMKNSGTSNSIVLSREYSVEQNGVTFYNGKYNYVYSENKGDNEPRACNPYEIYGVI